MLLVRFGRGPWKTYGDVYWVDRIRNFLFVLREEDGGSEEWDGRRDFLLPLLDEVVLLLDFRKTNLEWNPSETI